MQLKGIMRKDVATIDDQESVAKAAQRMRQDNIGCLVVTNANTVRGIVTDRDLTIRCLSEGHNAQQCKVAGHMTSPAVTARPDMDVLDAAHLMNEKQIKRLPVVEGQQLAGLVSVSDIALALDGPVHDLLLSMGGARRAA